MALLFCAPRQRGADEEKEADGETKQGDSARPLPAALCSPQCQSPPSAEARHPSSTTRSVYAQANRRPALYPHTPAQHNGIERHNAAVVKQSVGAVKLLPIPLTNLMERL